jgi:hypothetical protein
MGNRPNHALSTVYLNDNVNSGFNYFDVLFWQDGQIMALITEDYLDMVELRASKALVGYWEFTDNLEVQKNFSVHLKQYFLTANPLMILALIDEIKSLREKDVIKG